MKYTVAEFRKNTREILNAVDHGADVIIVRYDSEYRLVPASSLEPVYGIDPSFAAIAGQPESDILKETRKNMAELVHKGRAKQAELMEKDIVSDLDVAIEGRTLKVNVVPNKARTKSHIEEKYGADKKMAIPAGIEKVESCPHGYAKGFCKKADCNRKYQK